MLVVVIATPDILKYTEGDMRVVASIYEGGRCSDEISFSCLEAAENWVHTRWPSIKEMMPTTPPTPIDGKYYDDPEIRWVGTAE